MRRHTLTICLVLLTTFTFAQDFNLSATAGYLNINSIFKVDSEKRDLDFKSNGFYFGAQSEINLADKIDLQPEIALALNAEGDAIYIGALGSYQATQEFSVLFGPTLNVILEDVANGYQTLGIFLGFGGSYDITEKIYAQAKYNVQLNDYYTGSADVSSKVNFLMIGIGYRFL
ncbi:hypothetical protein EYD45_09635 [Hyunsoonleella flava]|uniref:Outer membrane protein beta-barrel domain-containing protein n=1 Tax=Hyunsoonleella flava TaxID=2527939 RepID=A0A4Q9FE36_9FLAO|nr:hypothetical protein [Hyunsoonleella flava]TBN03263.1 hypothetical protein EYD45_09635 [Hyunsoonleella flava]